MKRKAKPNTEKVRSEKPKRQLELQANGDDKPLPQKRRAV